MTQQQNAELLIEVIAALISSADPAALGGAPGEYDLQIQEIFKYIYNNKGPVNGGILLQVFTDSFPDCNVMKLEEFSRLAIEINDVVTKLKK